VHLTLKIQNVTNTGIR